MTTKEAPMERNQIHPTIETVAYYGAKGLPAGFQVKPNQFHGIDFEGHSLTVRLAAEEVGGSAITLYVLTPNISLRWKVEFDDAPESVIESALRSALDGAR